MRRVRRASGANGASAGRVLRRRPSPQERAPRRPLRRTVPLRPKRLRPRRRAKRSRTSVRATAAIAPNARDRPEREGRPPPRERRGGDRPDRQDRAASDRARAGATSRIAIAIAATRAIGATRRRRGVADPNSPFAKLAALKEQLEANKER